jgi:hypothetical protein
LQKASLSVGKRSKWSMQQKGNICEWIFSSKMLRTWNKKTHTFMHAHMPKDAQHETTK